jgi:hypothetical protein
MADLVQPKADFLNKIFVDTNIRKLVEDDLLWEKMLTTQAVNGMSVKYYREQYLDISTPNDSAQSRPIDEKLRNPHFRAPGAPFPHTTYGEPKEYNLGLYQLGLEVDISDEAVKYAEMENQQLKAQTKLANAFTSRVNAILGNAITENWTGSNINLVTLSTDWTDSTASATRPVKDIMGSMEKIEDVPGYSYQPSAALVSVQSYFDLRLWLAEKYYQYKEAASVIGPATKVTTVEGLPVYSSNMVTRDFCVVADFKAAGTLYQAEPLTTHQYWTDADHITHLQAYRTFNFALTDPKAVCLMSNTT